MRVPIHPPEIPDDPNAPRPERAPSTGTGTRVWLVRHAEVHDDWQKRAYGNLDVPLSAEGERQTADLAARFARFDVSSVASSSLMRALAMGRAIAEATRAPLSIDPRLREVSRGEWQGLPTDEFRARWAADAPSFVSDPWRWKAHGGESDLDLYARGWPVVLERVAIARGADVVIASHFNLIRALVTGAMGWSGRESFAFRTETARAALLVDAAGGWTLAANNVADPSSIEPAAARAR
jgi:broad specificity phosphatase PhoE